MVVSDELLVSSVCVHRARAADTAVAARTTATATAAAAALLGRAPLCA